MRAVIFLVARDWLNDEQASLALWLLAAYPCALFYGAIYTESLFLAGAAGAFYHLTRQQFGRAALWGVVVGLTRANGCFLSVPLALIAFSSWLPSGLRHEKKTVEGAAGWTAGVVPRLVVAGMPCVGTAFYSACLVVDRQSTRLGRPVTLPGGGVIQG